MTGQGSGPSETEEQLAEALTQIESLQAAAADAEARATTAAGEVTVLKEEHDQTRTQLTEAVTDAVAGLDAVKRRVLGLRLRYSAEKGEYTRNSTSAGLEVVVCRERPNCL